jgi:hypothetical protein
VLKKNGLQICSFATNIQSHSLPIGVYYLLGNKTNLSTSVTWLSANVTADRGGRSNG